MFYKDCGCSAVRIGKLNITNLWQCTPEFREYHHNKAPWSKWFSNPYFENRSRGKHIWFIFMGFEFCTI